MKLKTEIHKRGFVKKKKKMPTFKAHLKSGPILQFRQAQGAPSPASQPERDLCLSFTDELAQGPDCVRGPGANTMDETGPCSRHVPWGPCTVWCLQSWVSKDEQEFPEWRSIPGNWKQQRQ